MQFQFRYVFVTSLCVVLSLGWIKVGTGVNLLQSWFSLPPMIARV